MKQNLINIKEKVIRIENLVFVVVFILLMVEVIFK